MNVCIFCKSNEVNNLELGEMKALDGINIHYFCMLLSSSLVTNGEEDEGILGFLPSDIKKESRRAIRLKCHYCHQSGATIGCCIPSCNRSFHLNCGLKNNCLNQFTNEFKSFCHRHVEDGQERHSKDHLCVICLTEMGKYDKIQSVFAPCCKSEWFHKMCLMKLADTAGYFFKCPKCNDVEKFTDECMKRGIFIPQRDAAWETEENAFQELMERPNRCVADKCLCADGRDYDEPSNELLICETCGSSCIHKKCWHRKEPYYCCFPINSKIANGSEKRHNKKRTDENQNSSVKSKNNDFSTSKVGTVRRKRKIEQPSEDNEKRKKRRKVEATDKESRSPHAAKSTVDSSTKLDFTIKDIKNRQKFPITKIRNGTFDQLLRFTPKVLICPLSLDKIKISSKGIDLSVYCKTVTDKSLKTINVDTNKMIADRSLKTSNLDNNLKKDILITPSVISYAVISPPRKSGGKAFKNYTITSFFKPC